MISLGKMTHDGFEKIKVAKQQGIWNSAHTNLVKDRLPSDFKQALIAKRKACYNFQHFANSG